MEGLRLFLMISQVALAAGLVILILIQQSDGDSLSGIGGNNLNSAISKQTATSLIGKITFGLIILFLLNSLALGSLAKLSNQKIQKQLEQVIEEQSNLQQIQPLESESGNSVKQEKGSKKSLIPSVE